MYIVICVPNLVEIAPVDIYIYIYIRFFYIHIVICVPSLVEIQSYAGTYIHPFIYIYIYIIYIDR
jgi:hypothetical protein